MGTTAVENTQTTPPSGSLAEAAHAFRGILSKEDGTAPKRTPEQRTDTAHPDAEQAPAATDTGSEQAQSEASEETDEALPTPEAPKKWKVTVDGAAVEVEEEELLKSYSREADYTRKMQALAEQRRQVEAKETDELAGIRAERQKYAETLEKMHALVNPKEPDWETLKASLDPEEFGRRWVDYKSAKDAVDKIEAEQKRVRDIEAADAAEGFSKYVAEEHKKLVTALPDFGDTEKAKVLRADLAAFAESRGFTPEQLNAVTDHRLVLLLHDAMQGAKAAKKAPEIKNKIERVLEVATPGAKQETAPKNELRLAKQRLKETGSVDAAADVFREMLKPKSA